MLLTLSVKTAILVILLCVVSLLAFVPGPDRIRWLQRSRLLLTSRDSLCSLKAGIRAISFDTSGKSAAETRLLRRMRLIDRADDQTELWETPFGQFWIPKDNVGSLAYLLTEVERRVNGDGERGVVVVTSGRPQEVDGGATRSTRLRRLAVLRPLKVVITNMAEAEAFEVEVAKTLEVDQAGPYAAWLNLHRDWFQANCVRTVWTERVLVNGELGYAGTADLLVEHQEHGLTLVDYKTQGVKPGYKARAYSSWCQQLAAYRRAIGHPIACLSVVVNSTEPSAPVEHLWSEEELRAGLESFEAALVIWRNEKNYDPRVPLVEGSLVVA